MFEVTEIRHGVTIKFPSNWSNNMINMCLNLTYRSQLSARNIIYLDILDINMIVVIIFKDMILKNQKVMGA